MADELSDVSIVVVGRMNPSIHHPSWYKSQGLISDEDEKHALEQEDVLVVQQAARFSTPRFSVNCGPEQWSIIAPGNIVLEEMKNLTSSVFDHILAQTPVTAIGFNYRSHKPSHVSEVGSSFVSAMKNSGIGLADANIISASFNCALDNAPGLINLQLAPSQIEQSSIFISFNFHYDMTAVYKEPGQQWKMGQHMKKWSERDAIIREKLTSNIMSTLLGS